MHAPQSPASEWASSTDVRGPQDSWLRPPARIIDPSRETFIFQQMETDYHITDLVPGLSATDEGPAPVVRFFGITAEGNSVAVIIHGYMPYFYVPAPEGFDPRRCESFRAALNSRMGRSDARDMRKNFVIEVRVVQKESIIGYHADKKRPFLRITMALPMLVPSARTICEAGLTVEGYGDRTYQTYESNIPFVLRYMIDRGIVGASWLRFEPGTYQLVKEGSPERESTCQYEVHIVWDNVHSFPTTDPDYGSKIAPLRILSFDIECAGRKGVFPEPDKDPVIQIANCVTLQGESRPFIKNIFVLNSCSPIVGADVRCFKTERELLTAWRNFLSAVDADVVTGYNTTNFDLWYLIERAHTLKLSNFPYLGRTPQRTTIKDTTFSSKAFGKRESKEIKMFGRLNFDVLLIIQREYKLRSYSLNSVAAEFLGEQKEDVHHSIITDLFKGTNDERRRLAVYCIKDALLPQRLIDKLMLLINYMEMGRVTGVPLISLLAQGQQVKVLSQLYRVANADDLLIPAMKVKKPQGDKNKVAYEGAIVINPKRGFYELPIATLDFTSLYPSIMMAHNLCYTTLIKPSDVPHLDPSTYHRTPSGDYFVNNECRRGLLPRILTSLLEARSKAKDDLKRATEPLEKAVLNGRQLALKICANSVYGFTGAVVGKLPCLQISASVTSYGREMIELTAKLVTEKYTLANGYAHKADIIYGDTDSVMVNFGVESVAEAMDLGREAAKFVTTHFPNPINLDFEKVYFPYLLINKKRYAGLFWNRADKYDHMDTKGIETVRRDNCPLVKTSIQECLNRILINRDTESAVSYVKQIISDLLCNRLDVSLLVISKALSRNMTDYTSKQAHTELAERMRKRDPGTAPNVGDRVPYVIIQASKGAKNYEKSEDPLWVLDNNIPLDVQYYLQKQLAPPLKRIFKPILKDPKSLFQGDHTLAISLPTPTVGGIVGFTKKTLSCLGCKQPLAPNEKTVCKYCNADGREALIYQQKLQQVNRLEQEFNAAWTQCQRCQGSFHETVLCTSRDCPIFYMRRKIQKDLGDNRKIVERFEENAEDLAW